MGVDIIFFAEHRNAHGQWEIFGELEPNISFDPCEDPEFGQPELIPTTVPVVRCSALFAILGNVRNDYTKIPFNLIAPLRGIPEDATLITKRYYESHFGIGFHHSWLTLSEIDAFDWNQEIQCRGQVGLDVLHLFADNPKGFPYARWPKDKEWITYSHSTTEQCNARWRSTYAEAAHFTQFRELLIPFEADPTVRFIYWFCY